MNPTESHSSPLVLIADDEIHTAAMLTRIFEREGYSAHAAHDGGSALDLAQRLLPDLILLDVQMPVMDGFEVLRLLRENPRTSTIPTIIVTARARQPSDIAHGLDLGADDFVQKPFEPRELVARAQSKIRSRKLEDALHRRTQELAALLRVGEELSHHITVSDLMDLVPLLTLDLLPGDVAMIHLYGSELEIKNSRVQMRDDAVVLPSNEEIRSMFLQQQEGILWPPAASIIPGSQSGMAVSLNHAGELLGMVLVSAYHQQFDMSHLQLFSGVARQASLALRNAQLYSVERDYSAHLEEMVQAKTEELRVSHQLLLRAEKLASIGHLAASIAHEINNPLQPIRINLEDMLEDVLGGRPVDTRAIQATQESVERIRRIVSQLLEFSGRRNDDTDASELDVGTIIESIVELNAKSFEKEGKRISAQIASDLWILGNKDQLEQVFMNLVLNARAAMDNGGLLNIESTREGSDIVITIADTGCGIPEDNLNKIFDPFFSTKPTGTGLGLFVSYGIVQNHHGSIEVSSKIDVGTTFTIRLPAHLPSRSNQGYRSP